MTEDEIKEKFMKRARVYNNKGSVFEFSYSCLDVKDNYTIFWDENVEVIAVFYMPSSIILFPS